MGTVKLPFHNHFLPVCDDCKVVLAVFLPSCVEMLGRFVDFVVLSASCEGVAVDVVVTCCVVVFKGILLWAVTSSCVVCLLTEIVVVTVDCGNGAACFGVTLVVEGVFAVSSPKNSTQRIYF